MSRCLSSSKTPQKKRSAANFDAGADAITILEPFALLRAYWAIPDRGLRRKLRALFQSRDGNRDAKRPPWIDGALEAQGSAGRKQRNDSAAQSSKIERF
jgi:hypothetical protein